MSTWGRLLYISFTTILCPSLFSEKILSRWYYPLIVDNIFDKLLVTCGQLKLCIKPVDSVDNLEMLSTSLSTGVIPCGYWL